jgi:hypothetical protein
LHPLDLLSGAFFEMPKTAKPAPPQQASLKELWGKKRDKSTAAAPPKKEEQGDAMEVDIKKEEVEGTYWQSFTRVFLTHSSRAVEEEGN